MDFARLGGLGVKQLKKLELHYFSNLDFNACVTTEELQTMIRKTSSIYLSRTDVNSRKTMSSYTKLSDLFSCTNQLPLTIPKSKTQSFLSRFFSVVYKDENHFQQKKNFLKTNQSNCKHFLFF
eukprot:c23297_g1_i1.p1 GENE.c23297_g1_i1~~c23297_g1_i1.p1  ORF type:complete len:142 (-),score=16.28 c23297_g1_i1:5-373(-)